MKQRPLCKRHRQQVLNPSCFTSRSNSVKYASSKTQVHECAWKRSFNQLRVSTLEEKPLSLSHLFKCGAGSLQLFPSFPLMLNWSSAWAGRGEAQKSSETYHYQFVCDRAALLPGSKIQPWSGGRRQEAGLEIARGAKPYIYCLREHVEEIFPCLVSTTSITIRAQGGDWENMPLWTCKFERDCQRRSVELRETTGKWFRMREI